MTGCISGRLACSCSPPPRRRKGTIIARKTKTIIEDTDEGELVLTPDEIQEQEESDDFEAALGPDIKTISVFRLDAKTNKYAYVGTLGAENFHPGMVQEKFGGGNFRLRLRNSRGKWAETRNLLVEAAPGQEPGAGLNPAGDFRFEMLRDQMNRQHELVLRMIESHGQKEGNDLVKVIEAVAALRSFADPGAQVKSVVTA